MREIILLEHTSTTVGAKTTINERKCSGYYDPAGQFHLTACVGKSFVKNTVVAASENDEKRAA